MASLDAYKAPSIVSRQDRNQNDEEEVVLDPTALPTRNDSNTQEDDAEMQDASEPSKPKFAPVKDTTTVSQ